MKRLKNSIIVTSAALLLVCQPLHRGLQAADPYQQVVAPFAKKYCNQCHNARKARGELDLSRYRKSADVVRDFRRWSHVIDFIRRGEMPPAEARQPTPSERSVVVRALQSLLLSEAKKRAGDPGLVLPRRLSNTEYDLSVRDLIGVDIRPTKAFPVDPAGGEGFDNTGEALSMSPSLLKKYLAAAQHVSKHLVLKTSGITFAPFPVTSYNERKKLVEQAIIDFYRRHDVQIGDYLEAAWRYRHRQQGDRNLTIADWARRRRLSGKYLTLVWTTLNEASSGVGYLQQLGRLWRGIPAPSESSKSQRLPRQLLDLQRFVDSCRRVLGHREQALIRSNAGNWPISHLDFRARTAAARDRFDAARVRDRQLIRFQRLRAPGQRDNGESETLYLRLDLDTDRGGDAYVLLRRPLFSSNANLPRNKNEERKHAVVSLRDVLRQNSPAVAARLAFGRHPRGHKVAADSLVLKVPAVIEIPLSPAIRRQLDGKHLLVQCELERQHGSNVIVRIQHSSKTPPQGPFGVDTGLLCHMGGKGAEQLAASANRICSTFPNRFFYVDDKRGLAAGFHLVEGFFRDDKPLVEKVLDEQQSRELHQLWEQLDFVTNSAETLLRGFVWFERSERHVLHDKRFDFLRPEDPRLSEEKMLARFEREYLQKMGIKLVAGSLKPRLPSDKYTMIHGFFEQIRQGLVKQRKLLQSAEQKALADLNEVAQRAFGRTLRAKEAKSLAGLYQTLRSQGQDVEESLRGVFTAILMSPDFCYRFTESRSGSTVHPLSNDALASRVSYFLWSSLPDEPLRAVAAKGRLQDQAVLLAQTRRMLKSPKIEAFAREFFGQWLRYRDYLSNDSINVQSYPGYTDALRRAMFEEPARLATYLIQQDKPITDLLSSDTTFVNHVLAKHYGGTIAAQYQSRRSKLPQQKERPVAGLGGADDVWLRVDGLRVAGRGGLFGMGVILTKNSAGARTSPVKRGFWTVHHLLGQHFPPPPTDVPELPPNEKEAKQTIRQLIAAHTANQKCAICHVHFDSLGMTLEGFDAIGRSRKKDLAGRPIDDVAKLPNGKQAKGVAGLIEYVQHDRKQDFVRTFCRKFLGYALGRSVVLSDQPLLNDMEVSLEKNNYRFSALFETVVKSPQFRKQRGAD